MTSMVAWKIFSAGFCLGSLWAVVAISAPGLQIILSNYFTVKAARGTNQKHNTSCASTPVAERGIMLDR